MSMRDRKFREERIFLQSSVKSFIGNYQKYGKISEHDSSGLVTLV